MKKTRFIALVLAVAVMLIGAGYAWWSETVTITSEIKTGNLDVKVGAPEMYNGYKTDLGWEIDEPDYMPDPVLANLVNTDDDKITMKFDKLYPGAFVGAVIPIENKSSMAVRLDKIIGYEVETNGLAIAAENGASVGTWWTDDYEGFYIWNDDLTYGGMGWWSPSQLDEFVIQPGDTCNIIVRYRVSTDEEGNENTTATFTLEPVFDQFNKIN